MGWGGWQAGADSGGLVRAGAHAPSLPRHQPPANAQHAPLPLCSRLQQRGMARDSTWDGAAANYEEIFGWAKVDAPYAA